MDSADVVVDYSLSSIISSHPLLFQMLLSGILWSIGDLIAQRFESRSSSINTNKSNSNNSTNNTNPIPFKYNLHRTCRLGFYSCFIWSPATIYWFEFLVQLFPSSTLLSAIQRMLLDQLIWAPLVIITLFGTVGLLEGLSLQMVITRIKLSFWSTLYSNWLLWPLVQLINMSIIPAEYRIILANTVNIPWTAYLAYKAAGNSNTTNSNNSTYKSVPISDKPKKVFNADEDEIELMDSVV